jgi:hypothetical protein
VPLGFHPAFVMGHSAMNQSLADTFVQWNPDGDRAKWNA